MIRVKVPPDIAVCSSCGDPLTLDGDTLRCASGHESYLDGWGRRVQRWAAAVREWAQG